MWNQILLSAEHIMKVGDALIMAIFDHYKLDSDFATEVNPKQLPRCVENELAAFPYFISSDFLKRCKNSNQTH